MANGHDRMSKAKATDHHLIVSKYHDDQVWMFTNYGSLALIFPFIVLFYKQIQMSESTIGMLSGLRPCLTAVFGNMWAIIADRTGTHRIILVAGIVFSSLLRGSMWAYSSVAAQLLLVVFSELCSSPIGFISDAAIMAAGRGDADYGRCRLWASIGWGAVSPIAGIIVQHHSIKTVMVLHMLAGVLVAWPSSLLPVDALLRPGPSSATQTKTHRGSDQSEDGEQQWSLQAEWSGVQSPLYQDDHHPHHHHVGTAPPSHVLQNHTVQQSAASQGGTTETTTMRTPINASRPPPHPAAVPRGHSTPTWRSSSGTGGPRGQGGSAGGSHNLPLPPHGRQPHGAPMSRQSSRTPSRVGSGVLSRQASIEVHRQLSDALVRSASSGFAMVGGWSAAEDDDDGEGSGRVHDHHASKRLKPCDFEVVGGGAQGSGGDAVQGPGAIREPIGGSLWARLRPLLQDRDVLTFFTASLCMGIAMGTLTFLFLYVQAQGGSTTLLGLMLTFNCIAEVPVFFYSGAIIQRLGVEATMQLSLVAYALRFTAYLLLPYLPTLWLLLPVEMLQGITLGCSWSAGTVYCRRVAPPGMGTTTQGIFAGLYAGVGAGAGALLGGVLYQELGPRSVFGGGLLFIGMASACYTVQHWLHWQRTGAKGYQGLQV